jgi:PAS domain S-box-containing protein
MTVAMLTSCIDRQQLKDSNGHPHEPEAVAKVAQSSYDAAAFLAAIIESSDDAIVSKSLTGIITTWNRGAVRLFGYTAEEAVGQPITILIPADRLGEEPAILARIQAGERVEHFETVRRRKDGTLIDISLAISPIRGGDGRIIGASKIARDISEHKRAAEHQEMLLREMHHRVKNLFAVACSIVALQARTAQTAAELAISLKDRLLALARAHEMTLPPFAGAEAFVERPTTLFKLLAGILAPYDGEGGCRWKLTGDDVEVTAGEITNLALLFHEFSTNAAKYGCLSVPTGQLEITASLQGATLTLAWMEVGESQVLKGAPRPEPGFGSRLEQIIAQSLHATISREWQASGVCIRLTLPRSVP